MNRMNLQSKYIGEVLDGMSLEDLCAFFVESMNNDLNLLDDEELVEEVSHYSPNLIQK